MDADWAAWCLCLGPLSSPHVQGSAVWTVSHAEILYFQRPRPPPRSVLMAQLEFIGSAQAQSYANAKLVDKGFHKFKIGDVEVAQIYDGI